MNDEIAALPFEAAYTQLQEIIARLESGEPTLEESVVLFERGRLLNEHCQRLLDQAELKVTQITDGA
ncbi:MAG: exodeoxyribonuclease VII small subunit [Anaerolineae bacterium]|nr:exodeoxyribonuclease VII small subunit [Anaerolineae bacterium]NUQ06569.1 exodeoxyribonuclease VII small subunit [Anaerolineae bacterium]